MFSKNTFYKICNKKSIRENILGNYNSTIDMSNPSYLRKGNDEDVATLVSDMNAGKIKALITYNTNHSYTLVNADNFNKIWGAYSVFLRDNGNKIFILLQ